MVGYIQAETSYRNSNILNQVVINNIETYLAINIYCLDYDHDRGFTVLADLHCDMI